MLLDSCWSCLFVSFEQGVDPLSGSVEAGGGLCDRHVLFGDGFDDGHVGVVVAHGSLSSGGVNDVSTDLSPITGGVCGGGSVKDVLTDVSTVL